jgi:4-diphosphocytidyl-2-C-methyl-D-erythritol kinase
VRPKTLQATAYAKINLALHVRRRRDDGYHELETLFAFLDYGDTISVTSADAYALTQHGPFAGAAGADADNLVTRAALAANGGTLPSFHFDLDKRLPVAAGLGGGSADAAATLRLMGAGDRHDLAAALGADVPACLASVPVIGRGTGTELGPVTNDVEGLGCVLVNPGVPVPTGPVFKAWDGIDRGPMPQGSAREIMLSGRNDLEPPAISLCPQVAGVVESLRATDSLIARMSGSGATCFAIYPTLQDAQHAETQLRASNSDAWIVSGQLR